MKQWCSRYGNREKMGRKKNYEFVAFTTSPPHANAFSKRKASKDHAEFTKYIKKVSSNYRFVM